MGKYKMQIPLLSSYVSWYLFPVCTFTLVVRPWFQYNIPLIDQLTFFYTTANYCTYVAFTSSEELTVGWCVFTLIWTVSRETISI